VLTSNSSGPAHLVGARLTYADLSLFKVVAGLHYAFPKAMARTAKKYPNVMALHARVAARPRIAAYLASERRLPFNQQGIFRHYTELDRQPFVAESTASAIHQGISGSALRNVNRVDARQAQTATAGSILQITLGRLPCCEDSFSSSCF